MLGGRLTSNVVSSDLPGAPLDPEPRYARSLEAFVVLSGYPHAEDCDLFARHVLPALPHGPLEP